MGFLSFAVTYRVGRFGFSPTDQGFILAASWRLLHGEVPHRDIISPRPLGSPLLHVVDFLLPGPLIFMSRLISMTEIVLMTVAFAALVIRKTLSRWGPLLTGLVATASMINLNTFGLTAWHTVDGLLLSACGMWALDSGIRAQRTWHYRLGLVLLGFAALTKQSFMPVVPIGMVIVLLHPSRHRDRVGRAAQWRRRLVDLVYVAAPGLLYLGAVAAAGGLSDLVAQLTGAEPTYAKRLFTVWVTGPWLLLLLAAGSGLLIGLRHVRSRIGRPASIAEACVIMGLGALLVYILVDGELAPAGDWGVELFWLLVLACVIDWAWSRRWPWRALLVVLLVWMSSLSWGYDSPTFLGGTMALTALYLLARDMPRPLWAQRRSRLRTAVATALGMVTVLLSGVLLTHFHDASPYRDRPQGQLIADLGNIDPDLWGIRTNVDTYTYVKQIQNCIRRYPADKVAVLPDNAFVYPVFGLHNPFPMDWPRPLEMVADARGRMLATAQRLNEEREYLVLFQTVSARIGLPQGASVPQAVPEDAEIIDYAGLEYDIMSRLNGRRITCGSFVGVWTP